MIDIPTVTDVLDSVSGDLLLLFFLFLGSSSSSFSSLEEEEEDYNGRLFVDFSHVFVMKPPF